MSDGDVTLGSRVAVMESRMRNYDKHIEEFQLAINALRGEVADLKLKIYQALAVVGFIALVSPLIVAWLKP